MAILSGQLSPLARLALSQRSLTTEVPSSPVTYAQFYRLWPEQASMMLMSRSPASVLGRRLGLIGRFDPIR